MDDVTYKLQYNGRTLTYPGWNYSRFYLCELAIWSGERKTDVPTEPLSNVYGS